jgi:hypothetical protein
MITLAVFAILGAVLGLFVRPRMLGVALPTLLAAIVEGGVLWMVQMMEKQPNRELLIDRLQSIFGEGWIGAAGPVAAALMGALFAALMSAFTDGGKAAPVLTADNIRRRVGKNGRYARATGMVENRAIHAEAESRIDQILGL